MYDINPYMHEIFSGAHKKNAQLNRQNDFSFT